MTSDSTLTPRNAWYVAAWSDEITDTPLARRIYNRPVVLFRDHTGKAAALADYCCHRGAPLSCGQVTDRGLQCGYHGLTFNTEGTCVLIPGQDRIPAKARVPSYKLVEKDAFVWIWMGDADQANEADIVDYPFHNDTKNWPHQHTTYHIKSNYMLMVDNLMDLTHLGYVHTSTIGGNPMAHVEAKMDTAPTQTGLKFTRWLLNSIPPATYCKAVPFTGRVDRWQEFEYVAPGSVIQWTGAVDANTGAYDKGKRDGGFSLRIYHALTPETDETCFYFWSAANGYRQNDPQATKDLFREIDTAFQEDKHIVEMQQQRLHEFGESSLVDINTDAARVVMRRAVERLSAAPLAAE
jgi:phenylpropionate dioxygenase-like ring-hydroxylating dioxygenase large terminal subunit